jgi:hypothetical protein
VVFFLFERYVQTGTWIAKFFCQPKVNDIHKMGGLACTHDEVGRFKVAVDEVPGMNEFDARNLRDGHCCE